MSHERRPVDSAPSARAVHGRASMRTVGLVLAGIVAITVGHYTVSPHHIWLHDLMQRLYYVPIIVAALWFGLRGGIVTAVAVSLIYVPHIFMHWGGAHAGNIEKFLELVLYLAVGALTGFLADRLLAASLGRQRAYESLRESSARLLGAQEQLGKAERLVALGELAAELAHEIRNPLGSIKGAAEIFRDKLKADDPLREFAVIQCKEADRLDKVLESCLAVARSRDLHGAPGDVVVAAQEIVGIARANAGRAGVELVLELQAQLPLVKASSDSLRQVFLNLALNAIQAMPNGGRLCIKSAYDNGRVRVAFADTGPGVAPEDRELIFQPFFSRRPAGTGLGLAISRRLIAGAGGSLIVQSELGRGATFIVDVPEAARVP